MSNTLHVKKRTNAILMGIDSRRKDNQAIKFSKSGKYRKRTHELMTNQ